MDELKIHVSSTAELAALQRTEAELKKQIDAAKAAGQGYKQLEKDLSDVQSKIAGLTSNKEASNVISEFSNEIPGANTALRALEGGLGTVAVALGGVFTAFEAAKKSIEAFAEAQLQVASLDAALANSGQFTDGYRAKLQDLARELQETTAIAEEDWLGALTTLTKFGADESNIDKYTEAVKNLAGFLGGDLHQAAFLFGKAMQGSTTMLGRYGIQVDDSMSRTEKLNSIMEQVAQRGAGQLEARASTLIGSWKGLGLATDDVFKSFGRLINNTGVLQEGMGILKSALTVANSAMGGTVAAAEGVTNKIILQGQSADEAASSLADYSAALETVKGRSDDVTSALAEQTKLIDDNAAQVRDLTKAQKDLALAQIEADTSLSKEDKIKARGEVEKRFADSDLNASIAAAKDKIAAREVAIKSLEEIAAANRANLDDQRVRTEAAHKAEVEAQAMADGFNKITEEKDKLQRELAARDKTQAKLAASGIVDLAAESDKSALRREIAELEEKEAVIGKTKEQIKKLGDEAKKTADIEAANLKAAEAAIGEENKKNAATQARLQADIDAEKSKTESRKQVAAVEAQTADIKVTSSATAAKKEADAAAAALAAKKEMLALEILINEAKAAGNQEELERLQWIKAQREAEAKGLADDEATRAANAASAASGAGTHKSSSDAGSSLRGGESKTKTSVGPDTNDAFSDNVPIGESLLDYYNDTKDRPVGAVNGKSILPDHPQPNTSGGQGAADTKAAADALAKQAHEHGQRRTHAHGRACHRHVCADRPI
jgi:hypothetical protein